MRRRMKFGWSAMAVACLLAIGFVPAATAQQDVCINVDGVQIYQFGSATCDSGDGSAAVAVGDFSSASAGIGSFGGVGGDGNTAVVTGDDSSAGAGNGGFGFGGDNNTAVVTGDVSSADAGNGVFGVGGNDNTALVTGDDSSAGAGNGFFGVGGDDNSLVIVDDGTFATIGENGQSGCFVVIVFGQVYGDAFCLP